MCRGLFKRSEAIEYADMPPCIGSIVKCFNHFFCDESGCHPERITEHVTNVRALSSAEPPMPGEYQVLDGAVFRFAWLYGYAEHMKHESSDPQWLAMRARWRASARTFPVQFKMIQDLTLAKIKLDQNVKMNEKVGGLTGYKLVFITARIAKDLKDAQQPSGQMDVYNHMMKVQWCDADRPTKGAVQMHLKIYARLSPKILRFLEALESHFGRAHGLNNLSNLDMVCQKTACKDASAATRHVRVILC